MNKLPADSSNAIAAYPLSSTIVPAMTIGQNATPIKTTIITQTHVRMEEKTKDRHGQIISHTVTDHQITTGNIKY